ncbi:MAG: SDR family oxidoreductase [Legionella sp.]|jgi:nucleoside-diphosphate-sugar epimerase
MKPIFFIFGFGYCAEFLAPKLVDMGYRIIGTTRDEHKLRQGQSLDVTLIDFNDEKIPTYLQQATNVLISVPPNATIKDPVLVQYRKLIMENATHIQWLAYLSSTGVYGDYNGAWVDETSDCRPLGQQGILRLEAETAWMDFANTYHLPLHIFRLAGIYGPQRNALERIISGKPYSIVKPSHFFSRIHVADIASALIASIKAPTPLSIYNVADDEPAPAHCVDAYAATLLDRPALPLIPYEEATLSPMEREFYSNNRRVSNTKLKNELQLTLAYPSYREGLLQLRELYS